VRELLVLGVVWVFFEIWEEFVSCWLWGMLIKGFLLGRVIGGCCLGDIFMYGFYRILL